MIEHLKRIKASQRTKRESKRADIKQHADKLIQGFQKLEESHARRAIWELFQNAIDLSDNCEVTIRITDKTFEFTHNGKPFTSNTLISLIKQVSSKNSNNEEEDEVGQYGTGFITTHSFGKEILLTGCLKEDDYYVHFEDFKIDRIAKNSEELIEKLIKQEEEVYGLVEHGKAKSECTENTKFSYQTKSELEKQYAHQTVSELELILPYVLAINNRLQIVNVIDEDQNKIKYWKGEITTENDVTVAHIHKNDTIKKVYTIASEDKNLLIILPLNEEGSAFPLEEKLSRIFLFYPLIGTENIGFNYIVHSKHFAPTEARDGIYLKSKNEQVQEKEKGNRSILENSFQRLIQFIKDRSFEIEDVHHLARLNLETDISDNLLLSEYYKDLQKEWVNQLIELPLVDTVEGEKNASEVLFLSCELLQDDDYFDSIYSIVALFWRNIPSKDIASTWTRYVNEWESESINYIDINLVAEKIRDTGTLDFFENTHNLMCFYKYIIKYNHGEVFNQYPILPNVNNNFGLQSQLNSHVEIDGVLIEVADVIAPDIPERYLKEGFEFTLTFAKYERKQFVKEINARISDYKVDKGSLLEPDILKAIIKYCSIFSSEKKGTRADLLELLSEYYAEDVQFTSLSSNLSDSDWWLTGLKCLLRNLIWDINSKSCDWVEENIEFLNRLVSVVHNYYEFNEIVSTLPIFPNQNFKLCKKSEMKIDQEVPSELKDLYDRILKPEKQIREILAHCDFDDYLNKNELRTPEVLGGEIENYLQIQNHGSLSQHDHIQDILEIIKIISDKPDWAKYFPIIENKKASIMLERISDKETKNDLFSIIGLDKDKIAQLGELSRQENLDRIIELGREALEEEKRRSVDFHFKHAIGTHIEELIRERIKSDLHCIEVNVDEEQGGQDIVIRSNDEVMYFIEVKSRWDNRNSITMSPLQMKKAVEHKTQYALCCVEMTDYKVGDPDRHSVEDVNDIINRIHVLPDIGVKIEPVLAGVLAVEDIENEISLTGDYRGIIPQPIVKTGENFEAFVEDIMAFALMNVSVDG